MQRVSSALRYELCRANSSLESHVHNIDSHAGEVTLLTRRLTQSTSRKKLEPEVRQLRDHLAATRERPIEREASRWIGEADAITDDLVGPEIADFNPGCDST
jgi:hypothetical protein